VPHTHASGSSRVTPFVPAPRLGRFFFNIDVRKYVIPIRSVARVREQQSLVAKTKPPKKAVLSFEFAAPRELISLDDYAQQRQFATTQNFTFRIIFVNFRQLFNNGNKPL
jgi:hypothetical protein